MDSGGVLVFGVSIQLSFSGCLLVAEPFLTNEVNTWVKVAYVRLTDGVWRLSRYQHVLGRNLNEATILAQNCCEPSEKVSSILCMGTYDDFMNSSVGDDIKAVAMVGMPMYRPFTDK